MKRFLTFLISCLTTLAYGQGENNIWTFGQNYSLDFNTSPPTVLDSSFYRGHPVNGNGITYSPSFNEWLYHKSIAVCSPTGALLFMVKFITGATPLPVNNIWDRYEHPIAGTDLLNNMPLFGSPIVIPHPGNTSQYYIFYIRSNGLVYSLFDMSLNGGLGNIVAGKKNIPLTGWNTIADDRMTAVKGCNGVWLVVRSYIANEYLSFPVGYDGLTTEPVVSQCGNLPLLNYGLSNGNFVSSPAGTMLAGGFWEGGAFNFPGGVELYDFEKCSGKVKNARLLETNQWISGACFSPDNSKLYTTENDGPYFGGAGPYYYGKVYQYNLDLPTTADIISSKTLVLTNPHHWNDYLCVPDVSWFGDLRLGPDGKIYILDQHPYECPDPAIPKMTFHVIHQPNNLGLACVPQTEALYSPSNNMINMSPTNGLTDLPKIIITAGPPPDTLYGNTYTIDACFKDSITLYAASAKACYLWDNGLRDSFRIVYDDGAYVVAYFQDCTVILDTFKVQFSRLPDMDRLIYGCPGDIELQIKKIAGDTALLSYELRNESGELVRSAQSSSGFQFKSLDAGSYALQIKREPWCDTTIHIQLDAYPAPELIVTPSDTTIRYGDSIRLRASGAMLYSWWPASSLDTPVGPHPIAMPLVPTTYSVVGFNAYGCRDTGQIWVNSDFKMPDIVPNAFSPNGDGMNDIFTVSGLTYQKIRLFEIYNRFGQRVFSSTSSAGWNGTQNGLPCEMGTYHYLIVLDYPDGKSKTFKGDVLLLR